MGNETRVCHLLHSLDIGGAEVLAAKIGRQVGGPASTVFACLDQLGTQSEQLKAEGFTVELLHRKRGLDPACALRLAAFLRRERIDVVHAHQYLPFFYASVARLLGSRVPRVLFTEHGRLFPDFRNPKRTLVTPWLLQRHDRVTAVGESVREALVKYEEIPRERIELVYNGVRIGEYEKQAVHRAEVREELGLTPSDVAIVTVARLDPIKDHATSIRAMKLLRQRAPSAKLLLAGDGPERTRLEGLIRDEQVGDSVKLLGMRRDVPRLLAGADAFLLTSVSEGIPLTTLEAMAAGLPVVGTRVGGMAEVIDEEKTGFLTPSGDKVAIAKALERLTLEPELRRRFGEAGRARARERFDEASMMKTYRDMYREMKQSTLHS